MAAPWWASPGGSNKTRGKALAQIAEDLARTLGAAPHGCIVAWDGAPEPRIVFATGNTEAGIQARAASVLALREVLNIELLLNEILEFARPPSLSMVPGVPLTPIEEAVASVEAEWATRGVKFARKMPERMAPVPLDPVRVRTAVKILCRQ